MRHIVVFISVGVTLLIDHDSLGFQRVEFLKLATSRSHVSYVLSNKLLILGGDGVGVIIC